ncbi:hypothetical protein ERO13_A10G118300v2 [Gossypium hirsutum]|uniref:Pentatricopeptide repeat-containing protein At3g22690 n=4 Tax=Gossypium TaxID=3633 RepID=A0A1U8IKR0_GOSHI|nr:pentatricopeptide repeat-containing protein At3g22690-like [Gossypium hirsutum]KAB1669913.1 hypothetical protein ES319_1Z215000v1 [Gossypium barbadense]KAG4179666.1 hypothetical protein ERO13_A10G118300v2 [Gossypium hirsutum]TYI06170.1 hypothetical protein ES332_A10G139200v1 [Gossypium tomentosum]TYJ14672.1 hypothetical protein E1A91_A10G132000v1 [Gossypium mustelinum]
MAATSLSPVITSQALKALTNQTLPKTNDSSPTGSLKDCRNLTELRKLHCQIAKQGLIHRPSTVAKLISTCTALGTFESLVYAKNILNQFRYDNQNDGTLFMYNSLIRGYSSIGLGKEAIWVYLEMLSLGISPDKYTFPYLLSAYTKISATAEGFQVHGSVIKMGFQGDMFILNSLIHFYAECGEIVLGQKVFDEMIDRNVVSWTSLICGYARSGLAKEAVELFFEMVEEGTRPNSVTMVCVISACAKLRDLELGERVRGYISSLGVKVNTLMVNSLVDMYMKCGAFDTAKRLFDECEQKNLVVCNTIMSNYVHSGMVREALFILEAMLRQRLVPDRVTILSTISVSAQLGSIFLGKCCHAYVLRNGLEGWDSISNALIDMYMKCGKQEVAFAVFHHMANKTVVSWNSVMAGYIRNGDLSSAWEVFNNMPESDLVSWNTIISALVQESMFEQAIELFRTMQNKGIKADRVTMVSIASACGYLGALDLAKWIHAYIKMNKIPCDLRLSTALVDMFARCGDPSTAMKIFNNIEKRDVSAWTAAIGAMAMEGNGNQAIELFNKMLRQGVKPDGVVFVGLLTACSHGGLVEQGRDIFKSMTSVHKISPQIVHYGCMVDLLGRAGFLEEALDLIKLMPMEPNDVIWGSLLAACRMHRNLDMAGYATERMKELASDRTGIQVLLSNIYASAGKWTDVAKVRLQLKEKGARKVPGSSSIEVNGQIHEFTSGDESHPERMHIAAMLDEMHCRVEAAGHAPDLSNVLLNVDEEEKEYVLSRHSEKLAIAFGLISTDQGTPIRVVKNLRICSDCHSFAKLVSKTYNREIIVRDNNRFHFFQRGVCSCNDYW